MERRLGRLRRPAGARFLHLDNYPKLRAPKASPSWDGTPGATFAMYGNDALGNCTFAAIANQASMQVAAEGGSLAFSEQAVIDAYLTHTGGLDVGANMLAVVRRVATTGFPNSGEFKLDAGAGIAFRDHEEVKARAEQFTGLYVGAQLPDDWGVGASRGLWDVTGPPNEDNGHAFVLVKYQAAGATDRLFVATWGEVLELTWAWWDAYVDEAYVLLDKGRRAVDVVGCADLLEDAAQLARQSGMGA